MRPSRLSLFLAFVSLCLAPAVSQQTPVSTHVEVDETHLTALHGSVHPLAQPRYDRGPVDPGFHAYRLLLRLARPADREHALQQFLKDAHSPASKSFHQWLTPEQFGTQFGALDEDQHVVTAWLESHGLSVDRVAKDRTTVEFSGTAAQLSEALHTQIHRYVVDGKTSYANSVELSVPEAIHSRIATFVPLNSFPLDSYATPVGTADYSRETHRATLIPTPETDLTSNNKPFYALGPEDFATQYNVAPVYAAGDSGTGQTIGIIGASSINLALVDAYRTLFNLPASHTQIIVDGTDPGDPSSPNVEAFLDVEASGSVAPAATVNLYIAGGQPLTSSLELAAMRAVEDNQASVLSISYGNCEQLIGSANQFWNALWEQAAAQGQTVFVSSGDSGPTTCTVVETSSTGGSGLTSTLSVNGISSTPWNVSVGGTDFYYADYAAGAPSIASLWNATNDASNGSLRAPLPEQPWDNALGFDITPFNYSSFSVPTVAGGGGVSNCSQQTTPSPSSGTTSTPTCTGGYPKPDWQVAPGVPNDQARDLPDVSLFAANGYNLTAWPICAEPGDCTPNSTGGYHVFLVGGTSASSPAMAGVMALIDEKYGRQGQANFTLYALARKDPAIFHDITVGTNDVLCNRNSGPLCATPDPSSSFVDSFGLYPAGTGYDLATGLGSVDVGKLFAEWNSAPGTVTATTLQVSPATFVHGSSVSVTTTVAASSGSAMPTGNVTLASTTAPLRDDPLIALSNGTATTTLSTLPGGVYNLVADYGGDSSFAPSASSPIALTVTPEPTTMTLQLLTSLPNLATPPITLSTEPYGSSFHFEATPTGTSGTAGLATGTVTFTDGAASTVIPVNINGIATWNPQVLALGAHTVTAAYSGDASFGPITATPIALTVVKGTPLFSAFPESFAQFDTSLNQNVYTAGTNLVVHVLLRGTGFSVPPSGSVTVSLGSITQTVVLNPNEYLSDNLANAFVTFPAVPVGAYTLTASYAGDSNWTASSYSYPINVIFAATGAVPTTTALTLSSAAVDSSGSVSVTATVTETAPPSQTFVGSSSGTVVLFGNGTSIASLRVTASANGSNPLVYTGTATIPATVFPLGTLQIVGVYLGGFNDTSSISPPVGLTVTASDFSLTIAASSLTVKAGQTATLPVQLAGPYGVGLPVTLSCASPSTAITCAITPGSATVTGTATATLTINAFTTTTTGANLSPARPGSLFDLRKTAAALALLFAFIMPGRRRKVLTRWTGSLLLLFVAASFAVGCGGNGGSGAPPTSTPPPTTTQANAPTGTYTITVKGVSGGVEHVTAVSFQIQ